MFKYDNLSDLLGKRLSYNKLAAALIVIFSLVILLLFWFLSKHYYENISTAKFETNILENIDSIEKRISRYENILLSSAGFLRGSQHVNRQEWHDFIEILEIKKNYPGIQGIGFSKMLQPDEISKTEQEMRADGFPSFTVKPDGEREQYSAILYLEPMDERNTQAIGYDMFSEPTRRKAMEIARDTGHTSLSGRVTLIQEIDSKVQPGMLMYLPVYKKGLKTDTVDERRKALIGFVYSAFRMNDLMSKIVLHETLLNFEIYDSENISDSHLLYRAFEPSSYVSKYNSAKTLKINDRTWHINFSSTEEFDDLMRSQYPLFTTLGGVVVYFLLLFIIFTLIKGKQLLLFQAKELFKLSQAVEQSPNSIVITDLKGNIEYVNPTFSLITGYSKHEALGKNPRFLQSNLTAAKTYDDMWANLTLGKAWHGEFINKRKDGLEYIEAVKSSPIFQADGTISHYMAIKEDITDKKHSEERIHYLANFDSLTGLPNRFQLEERIEYAINIAKRNNEHFTIMFLDLDHFKDINDTLGHRIGDRLLIELANRFKSTLREVDMVSRLGGDEFIFLLPNTNAEGVSHIAQKLLKTIDEPFRIDTNELIVTASIGIAVYPIDGTNQETLSRNADTAMYRAKQDGRNKYCFFTEAMQKRSARNLHLTNALHHALERDEFYLVYQPQLSMHDGRIIGAEALLRWKHPEFGEISPVEFIPLAEDSGLILPIGEWVLRTALTQTKKLILNNFSPMTMAVNISAVQFRQPHLSEYIISILDETGVSPKYLELELTEAAAMHDPQSAYSIMDALHEHGIRMSIDDFGTGYSSLSYLKKFKVSKLKIDKSFVSDISIDPDDKAIVSAIIKMAHSLGLQTIAEGVETIEQLDYLRDQGCDEIQGYYYSKPLEAEEFEKFLRRVI